jgi:hypothetical protein
VLCRNKVIELGNVHLPQPSMPQSLDYDYNTYLAVTLSTASHIHFQPSSLLAVHPSLAYHGQVGGLQDVQLFAVPKTDWDQVGEDILAVLRAKQGVLGVHVQMPKQRVKRGSDEL